MSNTIKITRPALAKILTESGVDKWKKGHNRWRSRKEIMKVLLAMAMADGKVEISEYDRAGWRIHGKPGEAEWEIHLWPYSYYAGPNAMMQDRDKLEAALTKAGVQWSRRTATSPTRVQQIQTKE